MLSSFLNGQECPFSAVEAAVDTTAVSEPDHSGGILLPCWADVSPWNVSLVLLVARICFLCLVLEQDKDLPFQNVEILI